MSDLKSKTVRTELEKRRDSRSAQSRIVLDEHRPQIERLQRRLFLRSSLSIGALAMLSGCNM
ncbi:MAG: probable sufite oxidase (EC [uncultured Paraburkholderia sp.]|nr:MAG: probable sufite oxidase (EC [uncultured Paraburkholderia sp.]CAH2933244.1 MAG: probable sufite oxidase (EC [uncultured Paraburkholderia sp.]